MVAGVVAVLLTAPGVRAAHDAVSLRASLLNGDLNAKTRDCSVAGCQRTGTVCVLNLDAGGYRCMECNGAGANCLNSALPCCGSCTSGSYKCA